MSVVDTHMGKSAASRRRSTSKSPESNIDCPVQSEKTLHSRLCHVAEKWLTSVGCGVVFTELVTINTTGEIPDAIGWRGHTTILVEVKTNRSDFLADKRKVFRREPALGMGDFRIYLCPPGVIHPQDLPSGWGLIYATGDRGGRVQRVAGVPKGNCGWPPPPFVGNKVSETHMLLSAVRRIKLRGLLDCIYERFQQPKPTIEEQRAATAAFLAQHGIHNETTTCS